MIKLFRRKPATADSEADRERRRAEILKQAESALDVLQPSDLREIAAQAVARMQEVRDE